VKVVVLTTSYPRFEGDAAGRFVADAVERLRARNVDVDVVSPSSFRHFGIAFGAGIAGNLRRRPWLALVVPAFAASFVHAARTAACDADVVHAHWLPTAAVALATRRPVVLTVHGTDLELAHRARPLARALLGRVRVVLAVSESLAEDVRRLGATDVRVVPNGIALPPEIGDEAEPPQVLFAGRLSREKGIVELVEAARGHELVVAGDGPLRARVPGALGWLPHDELDRLYARAAVVACPSQREGFGVACAEAMAHARAVVASDVGGLRDLVVDGETGLLVPPGDVEALREALERLLGDRDLRRRLGTAARERVRGLASWGRVTEATFRAYDDASGGVGSTERGRAGSARAGTGKIGRVAETEHATDWQRQWEHEPLDLAAPQAEARTPRWLAQERLVRTRFGGFGELRVVELGAGRGLNGLLYAQRGADVTLVDNLDLPLEQAKRLFHANDAEAEYRVADVFALPDDLRETFDVSMSFGLCEHFLGERRLAVVRAHLDVLRPGGLALIGVPNRHAPVYRLWAALLMRRGTWPLGTEVPFSADELETLAKRAGGRPLEPRFGSFAASVVDHGVNQALFKLGRRGLPLPQVRLPVVDRMAYELMLPVVKPLD
jgi:glycosyltransferase involved in cell wall biosynthesis/2-polyprenyl-3-methyl-5-hydroxy-6-metoxy-1,4-benzoquinol methylase